MYTKKNLKILKLSTHRNKALIEECCQMAFQSKASQKIDGVLVDHKSFTKINPVFCLLKSGDLIGYIAFWKKTLKKDGTDFTTWVVWDFYIIPDERRKEYGTLVFDYALKNMKLNPEHIFYSWPISTYMTSFLIYKKNIRNIRAYSNYGWNPDVPLFEP